MQRKISDSMKMDRDKLSTYTSMRNNKMLNIEQRKIREDSIPDDTKQYIIQFWISNTQPSPEKNRIIRHRLSRNEFQYHQQHWQLGTDEELFKLYINHLKSLKSEDEAQRFKVGFTSFVGLTPYFIYSASERTALCMRHQNAQVMLHSYNQLRQSIHGNASTCSCHQCRNSQSSGCGC